MEEPARGLVRYEKPIVRHKDEVGDEDDPDQSIATQAGGHVIRIWYVQTLRMGNLKSCCVMWMMWMMVMHHAVDNGSIDNDGDIRNGRGRRPRTSTLARAAQQDTRIR